MFSLRKQYMLIFATSTGVLYWKVCYCKHSLSDKCLTHCYVGIFSSSYFSVRCTSCHVTGIMYANPKIKNLRMGSPWRCVFCLSPSEPLSGFSCTFVLKFLSPSKMW
jgi:hypothetical protein